MRARHALAVAAAAAFLPAQEPAPAKPAPVAAPKAAAPEQGRADLRFLVPPGQWPARLHLTDAKVVAAIETGLDWLRRHQSEDGRWDNDGFMAGKESDVEASELGAGSPTHDIAATGLAMLAFAREGRPPAGDPDHRALERAAKWLIAQQHANGRLGQAATADFIYDHAIGMLGLLAAAAATDDKAARDAAGKAADYLGQHRNPFGVWRYSPRDGDGDSSVTTWCALAYAAARDLGLKVDDNAFRCTRVWFNAVTGADGRTGYTKAGEGSSRAVGKVLAFPPNLNETLTAAGMLCGLALDDVQPKVNGRSVAVVVEKEPLWQPETGNVDYCCWFFGGEALRRVPEQKDGTWRAALVKALCAGQRTKGPLGGTWDPCDPWGEEGGRIYATALAVMALQSMYALPPR